MNIERKDGICRMRITDDPVFRAFDFRTTVLGQVTDEDQVVILDLSLVVLLHSPGLANLVAIHLALQKRGKRLQLTGLNEHNVRLLRTTNLDRLLVIG